MCALAEYCLLAGAEVSGSDRVRSAALGRLAALGAEVYLGARRDTIARAGLVVRSSAVPLTDEEVSLALAMGKRVIERHELLALIAEGFGTVAAVAGTHGKTTVTAMAAHILRECGVPFVAHIGGEPVGMGNLTVCGGEDGALPRGIFLTEGRSLRNLSKNVLSPWCGERTLSYVRVRMCAFGKVRTLGCTSVHTSFRVFRSAERGRR